MVHRSDFQAKEAQFLDANINVMLPARITRTDDRKLQELSSKVLAIECFKERLVAVLRVFIANRIGGRNKQGICAQFLHELVYFFRRVAGESAERPIPDISASIDDSHTVTHPFSKNAGTQYLQEWSFCLPRTGQNQDR